MSGTMIAQLISLLSLITLQRWFYGPKEFGQFKLFIEFVTIFSSIASLKLENAIVLEQNPNTLKKLIKITTSLSMISGVFSLIIFFISSFFNEQIHKLGETFSIWFFVPITVFFIGLFQIYTLYFTKISKFKTISGVKIVQSFTTATGQLTSGFISGSFIGLVIGRAVGVFITVMAYLKFYKKVNNEVILQDEEVSVNSVLKTYKDFILFTTPGVFISGVINFLSVFIFIHKFGDTIGGEIAAAHHYLLLLIAVFTTSFAQVFYSKIAQIQNSKDLRSTYFYWFNRLIIISVFSTALIYLIPNNWVELILSKKWSGLFSYVKIAMFWSFMMLIASSLSYIFIKVKKQKITFILDIMHLLMILGVLYFLDIYNINNPNKALWVFTSVQICFYVIAIGSSINALYSYKEIGKNDVV